MGAAGPSVFPVGTFLDTLTGANHTLVLDGDGNRMFRIVPAPSPGTDDALLAGTTSLGDTVWAVGLFRPAGPRAPLIMKHIVNQPMQSVTRRPPPQARSGIRVEASPEARLTRPALLPKVSSLALGTVEWQHWSRQQWDRDGNQHPPRDGELGAPLAEYLQPTAPRSPFGYRRCHGGPPGLNVLAAVAAVHAANRRP